MTGRLVQKLNKIIEYYQTPGCENLLNETNLNTVMSHYKDGKGTYTDVFKDDLAYALTVVTPANDAGRLMFDTDTIIIKLTAKDIGESLDVLAQRFNVFARMINYQNSHNGESLTNPLKEVKI